MRPRQKAAGRKAQAKRPGRTGVKSSRVKPGATKSSKFELSASSDLLQLFFELSADSIFIGHQAGSIDYANPAASKLFGYTPKEFRRRGGYVLADLNDPNYLSFIAERDRQGRARGEMTLIRRDGSKFAGEASGAFVTNAAGLMRSLLIIKDITERKKAEEEKNHLVDQLRQLTRRQHRAREEERAAVAREIHDEFGQALTALKIDLSLVSRRLLPEQSDSLSKIESMLKLIDSTKINVQRLATELRPGVLDLLGLVAAIEWQLQQVAERSGLTYEFDSDNDELEIERDTATALFRVVQEALTNIVRYAEATRVTVKLSEQRDRLYLAISDNGKGIRESEIGDSHALGILGMRERVGALGGEITIKGVAGVGTTVAVQVPRAVLPEEDL